MSITEGDVIAIKIGDKDRFLCCVGEEKIGEKKLRFVDVESGSITLGQEIILWRKELMTTLDELWSCSAFLRISYLSKSDLRKGNLAKLSVHIKNAKGLDTFNDPSKKVFGYNLQGQRLCGESEAWNQTIKSLSK